MSSSSSKRSKFQDIFSSARPWIATPGIPRHNTILLFDNACKIIFIRTDGIYICNKLSIGCVYICYFS